MSLSKKKLPVDWENVDWTRDNWEIAIVVGRGVTCVRGVRQKLGKPAPVPFEQRLAEKRLARKITADLARGTEG